MTDLRALLERVQKAQGPDRELDAILSCSFIFPDLRPARPDDFDGKYGFQPGNIKTEHGFLMSGQYTGSIDCAVELISVLLPDWWWSCGYCQLTNDATVRPRATVGPDFRASQAAHDLVNKYKHFDEGFDGDRRDGNVPLALLSAMLQGLIAKAEAEEGVGEF